MKMLLRTGALILIIISVWIAYQNADVITQYKNQKKAHLTESQVDLLEQCRVSMQTLRSQKLPETYKTLKINIRDHRLENDPILQDIKRCFAIDRKSKYSGELEIFSSDFQDVRSNDLQVQLGVFDLDTKNKVGEVGFRVKHESPEKNDPRLPDR